MDKVNFTGVISVSKWSNLTQVDRHYPTSLAQDKLILSVTNDILTKKNSSSSKTFFYQVLEQVLGQKISLNKSNSSVFKSKNEIRVIPNEPKLFEGESIIINVEA